MLNFRQFNKQALKSRICTAKGQGLLRSEAVALPEISPRIGVSRGQAKASPRDGAATMSYGRKGRPSTPINQVLSHRWAEEGEQELQQYYAEALLLKNAPPSARRIHLTTASRGHASKAKSMNEPEVTKEPFKLTKFKNVQKRLHTFRGQPKAYEDLEGSALRCGTPPPSLADRIPPDCSEADVQLS